MRKKEVKESDVAKRDNVLEKLGNKQSKMLRVIVGVDQQKSRQREIMFPR